jgi:hypothetical protein
MRFTGAVVGCWHSQPYPPGAGLADLPLFFGVRGRMPLVNIVDLWNRRLIGLDFSIAWRLTANTIFKTPFSIMVRAFTPYF